MLNETNKFIRVTAPRLNIDNNVLLGIKKIKIKHHKVVDIDDSLLPNPDILFNSLAKKYSDFKGLFFLDAGVYHCIQGIFPNDIYYAILSHISITDFQSVDRMIDTINLSRIIVPMTKSAFTYNPNKFNRIVQSRGTFDIDISHFINPLSNDTLIDAIFGDPGFFAINHMLYIDDYIYIGYYYDNDFLVFALKFSNKLELITLYTASTNNIIGNDLDIYNLMRDVYEK